MQIRHWLSETLPLLRHSDSAKRDAEVILGHVLNKPRSWLLAFDDYELTPEQQAMLAKFVERRAQGEPIAYLCGQREFWSLPLAVSPATLIPRPDTEVLVEQALSLLPCQPVTVLDLGTGTGAIALAMASERPESQFLGVDRIEQAVTLAQTNAERLAMANCRFQVSHWFNQIPPSQFDMIVTNPPYIDADDPHLTQGDVTFEPRSALVAEAQGLADITLIIQQAPNWLVLGGWLVVEHGWQQHHQVQEIFAAVGFDAIDTRYDYGGNPRVTYGKFAQASKKL
ncbi:peptide chain release factor N(5)-glutamine methyltransferase [Rosenbergiella australiborealis]|uniref:Release factor glutamine methyltransferase n=1 Tax=Rosenbergiella australiborealis TaxID=1544696 RepID=A0ABS5T2I4_9GAMM|nr:peptide chain release factor N(5)-glutamine methyltransferase [Rosenbergiella australiborealis]MBT0726541.1 peptide chain release factor N(5)-glutamine methyltransferase [Rosenbergiella australiborealis]